MKFVDEDKTVKAVTSMSGQRTIDPHGESARIALNLFNDLEATLDQVAEGNPRIAGLEKDGVSRNADLQALLEVSLAINSSLVLDDVLQIVMHRAIELMQAERGLIMLLDEAGDLQVKSAYNLCKEEIMEEDFKISSSITGKVAESGKSVYTSDAMADDRYAQQQSVLELHLRSIMCVPIKVRERVIGVFYLDNSNQARMFLKSDLYLFELYAQMVSNALDNAGIYDSLLRMTHYHESVVANTPVGVVVLDTRGNIATINRIALEILDLNRDAVRVIGADKPSTVFVDILPQEEKPRWRKMINMVVTSGHELADPRYFHNTGYLEKVLSLKLSPLDVLPCGGKGIIMAIEDVTEKVLMEKYVILSEKLVARGEMAAAVAHELNNYLSIITNNAELLQLNLDREKFDKVKFNSKSITENVFKIKRFVDNLMDFAKPESEYISYDIKHLIDDLLFSLRIQPRFKLVHFTIDLNSEIPSSEMDVGQIQQVLMNLLNNSADAIEERALSCQLQNESFSRQIGIQARYDTSSESIVLEISDNGNGMSEETAAKIFNLHFTTKKHGHGLGLHNCKSIIEQHGGQIEVSSKTGEGTVFRITLPRFQKKHNK